MLMNFWLDLSPISKILHACRNPKTRKDPNPLVSSILDIKLTFPASKFCAYFQIHIDLYFFSFLMFH